MSEIVIRTRRLSKEYVRDEFHVTALDAVDIDIDRGDFVALMGPSGSGNQRCCTSSPLWTVPATATLKCSGQISAP